MANYGSPISHKARGGRVYIVGIVFIYVVIFSCAMLFGKWSIEAKLDSQNHHLTMLTNAVYGYRESVEKEMQILAIHTDTVNQLIVKFENAMSSSSVGIGSATPNLHLHKLAREKDKKAREAARRAKLADEESTSDTADAWMKE